MAGARQCHGNLRPLSAAGGNDGGGHLRGRGGHVLPPLRPARVVLVHRGWEHPRQEGAPGRLAARKREQWLLTASWGQADGFGQGPVRSGGREGGADAGGRGRGRGGRGDLPQGDLTTGKQRAAARQLGSSLRTIVRS